MLTPEKERVRKHEIFRAGISGGRTPWNLWRMEPKICRKIDTSLLNTRRKWKSVPQAESPGLRNCSSRCLGLIFGSSVFLSSSYMGELGIWKVAVKLWTFLGVQFVLQTGLEKPVKLKQEGWKGWDALALAKCLGEGQARWPEVKVCLAVSRWAQGFCNGPYYLVILCSSVTAAMFQLFPV